MRAKTASVGVDVDSLRHYYRIHGLDEDAASNAAWEIGVPRFVELFDAVGIPATFYCIAEDLEYPGNDARMRALVAAGHEIGNHRLNHFYDLTRLDSAAMQTQVAESRRQLSEASGTEVVGFRSPGYNTNTELIEQVFAAGHRYDSSVFPCAPYYLAKASVMGWLHLRRRPSASILGSPRVLVAPSEPYRMDAEEPHKAGSSAHVQFPIAVAAGVPLIGTAFTALRQSASVAVTEIALRLRKHLTIEFHAVDLMSLDDDGLDSRLAVQPDLKVSVAAKRGIFERILKRVAASTDVVRLDHLSNQI